HTCAAPDGALQPAMPPKPVRTSAVMTPGRQLVAEQRESSAVLAVIIVRNVDRYQWSGSMAIDNFPDGNLDASMRDVCAGTVVLANCM
ncbi:MAG: hypothetical protein WAR81_19100, partial [Pseudomonadales bacterium]